MQVGELQGCIDFKEKASIGDCTTDNGRFSSKLLGQQIQTLLGGNNHKDYQVSFINLVFRYI